MNIHLLDKRAYYIKIKTANSFIHSFIIIIIITRHQLDLDRPVSALSDSPFRGLPSRLRPFVI